MNIAIIPARGGSKRIPQKNIKDFCGKPMIAWTIEAAKKSKLFDHIMVSTDDKEITEIAGNLGVEVPFIRPAELSDDFTGTTEVVSHATKWAVEQGFKLSAVCCIYATAPFLQASDLSRGLRLLQSGQWDYTFSATDFSSTIYRAFKQIPSGGLEMVFPEHFSTRSQDLPIAFHDAGQFYWGSVDAWLQKRIIFSNRAAPVFIPRIRVQDIDVPEDWFIAETLFKALDLSNITSKF